MTPRGLTQEQRFWSFVDKSNEDGCWPWTGHQNNYGYGMFKYNDVHTSASRVSYWIAYGPIDRGMHVCHRCDNPLCVRPDHLFVASPHENKMDAARKGRLTVGYNDVGKTVSATFTLNERHLDTIDRVARQRHTKRSEALRYILEDWAADQPADSGK